MNIFISNATVVKHTLPDLIPSSIRSIQQLQNQQLTHIIETPVFSLFNFRRPGDVKSTPSARGALYIVYVLSAEEHGLYNMIRVRAPCQQSLVHADVAPPCRRPEDSVLLEYFRRMF